MTDALSEQGDGSSEVCCFGADARVTVGDEQHALKALRKGVALATLHCPPMNRWSTNSHALRVGQGVRQFISFVYDSWTFCGGGPARLAGCRRYKKPLNRRTNRLGTHIDGEASCRYAIQPTSRSGHPAMSGPRPPNQRGTTGR